MTSSGRIVRPPTSIVSPASNRAKSWPRNSEVVGLHDVKAAAFGAFLDPVGERRYGVVGMCGTNGMSPEVRPTRSAEGVEMHRESEGEVAHGEHTFEHLLRIGRTVQVKRLGAIVEAHALDEAREAQKVVAVEMRDKNPSDAHERDRRQEKLPLGPFSAVQEDELLLRVQSDRARGPFLSRPRSRGAQEYDAHGRRMSAPLIGPRGPRQSRPLPGSRFTSPEIDLVPPGKIAGTWWTGTASRSSGARAWDWDRIAEDSKVAYQAPRGVTDKGRALRTLYAKRARTASREPVAEQPLATQNAARSPSGPSRVSACCSHP